MKPQYKRRFQPYRKAVLLGVIILYAFCYYYGYPTNLWLYWWAWFSIVLLILPLVFGRFSCGWLCMYSGMMELVTNKLTYPRLQLLHWMKSWYAVFAWAWLLGTLEIFYDLDFWLWYIHFYDILAIGLGLIIIPRAWCRYICPLGTYVTVYSRVKTFGIKVNPVQCLNCNPCKIEEICPIWINIKEEACKRNLTKAPTHCMSCFKCVETCPGHVTSFGRVK